MGTVEISRPPTVLLRLLQALVDGQQESPGKQWQLLEARAMDDWATKAAMVENFILASVSSERKD
jgi:hypothetical protein